MRALWVSSFWLSSHWYKAYFSQFVQEIPTRLLDLLASPDFTSLLLSARKLQIAQYLGVSFFFFPLGCNTVRLITLVSHNKYSNYNANVNFVMLNYLLQGISVLWWVSERRGIIYKIPYYFSDQHSINKIQTKIK